MGRLKRIFRKILQLHAPMNGLQTRNPSGEQSGRNNRRQNGHGSGAKPWHPTLPGLRPLSGSTLLEVIVASILFLILFFLSMEMLVRLGTTQTDKTLLQVETDRRACEQEFRGQHFPAGEYHRPYTWGEITVTVSPYRRMEIIQELYFVTRIEKQNRQTVFRILKAVDHEPTQN